MQIWCHSQENTHTKKVFFLFPSHNLFYVKRQHIDSELHFNFTNTEGTVGALGCTSLDTLLTFQAHIFWHGLYFSFFSIYSMWTSPVHRAGKTKERSRRKKGKSDNSSYVVVVVRIFCFWSSPLFAPPKATCFTGVGFSICYEEVLYHSYQKWEKRAFCHTLITFGHNICQESSTL